MLMCLLVVVRCVKLLYLSSFNLFADGHHFWSGTGGWAWGSGERMDEAWILNKENGGCLFVWLVEELMSFLLDFIQRERLLFGE